MFLLIVLIFNFAACRITPSDSALLCPNCSAQYTKGDSKCAECGLSFVVENTVKCEACGADNSANSTACATCGNVFAQTPNGENNGNGNTDDNNNNNVDNGNNNNDSDEQMIPIDPEDYKNLLVIESIAGESDALIEMLDSSFTTTVLNTKFPDTFPTTMGEMLKYGEVILCNVANSDMPEGFDRLLQTYVSDFGGGLFTTCGNKPDSNKNDDMWEANAYTREDMYGTLYQSMLPVEIINYTPPIAVVIIIDNSGTMYNQGWEDYKNSRLYYAKIAAEAALDALTERDYVGIMSMNDDDSVDLLPRTDRDGILAQINAVNPGADTLFSIALDKAGKALSALPDVAKRHVIIITDGEPNDVEWTCEALRDNAEKGITTSIVGIQCSTPASALMKELLIDYAGMSESDFHNVYDIEYVSTILRETLEIPEIKDTNCVTFQPAFEKYSIITSGILESSLPTLDGFYGVKAKNGAEVILMGEYSPVYTQWSYGEGKVGTFACDLNGTWSSDFISSKIGARLINNIVSYLSPADSVLTYPEDTSSGIKKLYDNLGDLEEYVQLAGYESRTTNAELAKMLENEIYTLIRYHSTQKTVTDRAIKKGDNVTVSTKIRVYDENGELKDLAPSPGIEEEDYTTAANLSNFVIEDVGNGNFLKEIEDALLDNCYTGDIKFIDIRYDDQVQTEELKNKKVQIELTVHKIKDVILPEYNDSFIAQVTEYSTVDEFEAETKNNIISINAWYIYVDKCRIIKYPAEIIAYHENEFRQYYENYAKDNGMTFEEYVATCCSTMEEFVEIMQEYAQGTVEEELVLYSIVAHENLSFTESEYLAFAQQMMAEEQNCDTVEELEQLYTKEIIERSLYWKLAKELLIEHVVIE